MDEVEFKKISSNSIDYEIVQKLKHIKMIPLDLVWNDLGNWDVLSQTKDVCQTTKKVFQLSSNNNFIRGSDRIIATVGLENFIVIYTDDATLICKKGYAHRLKEIVEKINIKRYPQTKSHQTEPRPWGYFRVLIDRDNLKVKELSIKPNHRLSLQYHNYRSEHWVIASGEAKVFVEGKIKNLKKGDSIDIPIKAKHYIQNSSSDKLIVMKLN